MRTRWTAALAAWVFSVFGAWLTTAEEPPIASVTQLGGWRTLTKDDFISVNVDESTLRWDGNRVHNSGYPIGVTRSREEFENFELILDWKHMRAGGNSGCFLWVSDEALADLQPGQLPSGGIEIQMLDHDFRRQYLQKHPDARPLFFSTHGDVFPIGQSTMEPMLPTSPNGQRSFPREERSLGHGHWNHYHVRAIDGEVRLSVNGREVSGGTRCNPKVGYLCLESEGAPMQFRNIRVRRLPAGARQ